jgi:hypothetical protein
MLPGCSTRKARAANLDDMVMRIIHIATRSLWEDRGVEVRGMSVDWLVRALRWVPSQYLDYWLAPLIRSHWNDDVPCDDLAPMLRALFVHRESLAKTPLSILPFAHRLVVLHPFMVETVVKLLLEHQRDRVRTYLDPDIRTALVGIIVVLQRKAKHRAAAHTILDALYKIDPIDIDLILRELEAAH